MSANKIQMEEMPSALLLVFLSQVGERGAMPKSKPPSSGLYISLIKPLLAGAAGGTVSPVGIPSVRFRGWEADIVNQPA
jgi:hypothetical protein